MIYKTQEELVDAIALRVVQLREERAPQALPAPVQDEKPIGIKDACELLGVSEPTLREWRKKGLVPYRLIGDRYYFFRSELLAGSGKPYRKDGRRTRTVSSTTHGSKAA